MKFEFPLLKRRVKTLTMTGKMNLILVLFFSLHNCHNSHVFFLFRSVLSLLCDVNKLKLILKLDSNEKKHETSILDLSQPVSRALHTPLLLLNAVFLVWMTYFRIWAREFVCKKGEKGKINFLYSSSSLVHFHLIPFTFHSRHHSGLYIYRVQWTHLEMENANTHIYDSLRNCAINFKTLMHHN